MIRASAKKIGMQPERSAPANRKSCNPRKGKLKKVAEAKGMAKRSILIPPKEKVSVRKKLFRKDRTRVKVVRPEAAQKGKARKVKTICPSLRNCPTRTISNFNPSAHGLYFIQDAAVAQQLASKVKNDQLNVSFIMPQPQAIGKKAPIEMQIRLFKRQGTFQDTVLLTGHLHVLSGSVPETGRKFIQTRDYPAHLCLEDAIWT